MIRKLIIGIIGILFSGILLCLGILAGGSLQKQYDRNKEHKTDIITQIAVVNLDEGVEIDGKKNYYAQNMLKLPNNNFFLTNLEDARSGINNGRYAAYILVPISFSRSIESINGSPVKINLEYELNENLDESLKPEIVEQLKTFQLQLSENATYVYVSAILKEYHTAQDSSKTVLLNNDKSIDAIKNVDLEGLFPYFEPPALKVPEFKKIDYDISLFLNSNEEISNTMMTKVQESLLLGKNTFEYVKEAQQDLEKESENLESFMQDMEVNEESYEEGLIELERLIDVFNVDQQAKRNWLKTELASQSNATRNTGQQYVDLQLEAIMTALQEESDLNLEQMSEEIQMFVDLGIIQLQDENWVIISERLEQYKIMQEQMYQEMQEYIDIRLEEIHSQYEQQANDWKDEYVNGAYSELILSDDELAGVVLASLSNATITLATPSDAAINLDDSAIIRPTLATPDFPLRNAVAAGQEGKDETTDFWLDVPWLSWAMPERRIVLPDIITDSYDETVNQVETYYTLPTEEIQSTLDDKVIAAIDSQLDEDYLNLRDIIADFNNQSDEYQRSLEDFDPYSYLETSFMSSSLQDIAQNMRAVEREASEKSRGEEEQVNLIYSTAEKNTDDLQENINLAYDVSKENVVKTVQDIQALQTGNQQQNTKLLDEFTRQLSYTRVGSVGNKEAYDFISNPVLMTAKKNPGQSFLNMESDYQKTAFGVIIGFTFISVILTAAVFILKNQSRKE